MPHVVTEACILCRYTDCVEVCPVDAFHAGPKMLVIGEECIDCGLCVTECGPSAIYAEEDVPPDQEVFKVLNIKWSEKWPVINRKEAVLPDADQWKGRASKREHIPELLDLLESNKDAS